MQTVTTTLIWRGAILTVALALTMMAVLTPMDLGDWPAPEPAGTTTNVRRVQIDPLPSPVPVSVAAPARDILSPADQVTPVGSPVPDAISSVMVTVNLGIHATMR